MDDWLFRVLVIGAVAWVTWALFQPRYVLEIRIKAGQPHILKGKVTETFLHELAGVCRESGVVRGWVGGLPRGRRIALRFSRHFPPGSRQRLRNLWLELGQ